MFEQQHPLVTRIVVGLVALAVVLGVAWVGGWFFALLATAAAVLGGYEYYTLLGRGGFHPQMAGGLVWIALIVLSAVVPGLALDTVLTVGLLAVLIHALWRVEMPTQFFLATAAVAIYLGLMVNQAVRLRLLDDGFWLLLLAFAITWGNDSVAYFTGVSLGRHKIWPRLSPKKTWEGTVAGWLGAAVAALLVVWLSPLAMNLLVAALLGLVGGLLAFFGDLSISMVKRQVQVKDSGHVFPGHGGMLDRLDSLLFVIPFVYQVVRLL